MSLSGLKMHMQWVHKYALQILFIIFGLPFHLYSSTEFMLIMLFTVELFEMESQRTTVIFCIGTDFGLLAVKLSVTYIQFQFLAT